MESQVESQVQSEVEAQNMLAKVGRIYERSFRRSPYLTLAVVNGVLSFTGDAAAQVLPALLSGGVNAPFDFARSGRFWLFGTTMGPVGGKWNEMLELRFPLNPSSRTRSNSIPLGKLSEKSMSPSGHIMDMSKETNDRTSSSGSSGKKSASNRTMLIQALKRVATDQLFMGPIGLIIFFTYMGILEGVEWSEIESRLDAFYLKILFINWQVWPFIQLFNFRFMPLRLRVPFGASCGILWTVFLSFTTRPQMVAVEQIIANPVAGAIPKVN